MLDVNLTGTGNRSGGGYKGNISDVSFGSTVQKDETVSLRDKSDEGKASRAMMKALNVFSFSHASFVYPIAVAPLAIRRRFVESVYILFQTWAQKYDNALWQDDEELEFLVSVKRVAESLEPYMGI